jgi:adenosylmethionine-8-amino-7-oxononanoate aminotransferase
LDPGTVAAFIAEPVVGATLGAAVPPDDYWPAVREVCNRHAVLLIADEVMTGFGRTGAWFALDHWDVRADILVSGKGAASGYWPLGLCVASGAVHDTVQEAGGFVHGYTASHHVVGAAVGRAVLRRIRDQDLVEASRTRGELLHKELQRAIGDHPRVGDIRGRGLMVGIELVRDRDSKQPFARSEAVTERVKAAAMEHGLTVYPNTGFVGAGDGDLVLLGPPFIVTEEEIEQIVERLGAALEVVR